MLVRLSPGSAADLSPPFVVGEARLDNRSELLATLTYAARVPPSPTDFDLVAAALREWGHEFPRHVSGDWWVASWDAGRRELFLARDHFGNVGLHYWPTADRVIVGADLRSVLARDPARVSIDWQELAWFLLTSSAEASSTVFAGIRRVPPGHAVMITPDGERVWRYWSVETLPFNTQDDGFGTHLRDALSRAVERRVQDADVVAVALSSGLDSSTALALATPVVRGRRARLVALTAVPALTPQTPLPQGQAIDEGPVAGGFAASLGVEHRCLKAEECSPLQALRDALRILAEPQPGAGASYWMLDLLRAAKAEGAGILLTGQTGDFVMTGRTSASGLAARLGAGRWRDAAKRVTPYSVLALRSVGWQPSALRRPPWHAYSLINDTLVHETRVLERLRDAGYDARFLRPNRTDPGLMRWQSMVPVGAWWATLGRAFGLVVRDPFQDRAVMELTFGAPASGARAVRRARFRRAVGHLLPDDILEQRVKARQSADLPNRLRTSAAEVEALLDQIATSSDVRLAIDTGRSRRLWQEIQDVQSPDAYRRALQFMVMASVATLLTTWRSHLAPGGAWVVDTVAGGRSLP